MKEVFRQYTSKNGYTVTVYKYTDTEGVTFQVKHTNPTLSTGHFYNNRRDAIIAAQFLAGNY